MADIGCFVMCRLGEGEASAHTAQMQELVLPRMAACVVAALSHAGLQPSDVQARLQSIACSDCTDQSVSCQHQHVVVRLLIAMDVLQRGSSMGQVLAEHSAQLLLPWVLQHGGSSCYQALLSSHDEGLHMQLLHSCLTFLCGTACAGHHGACQLGLSELCALGERLLCLRM